MASVFFAALNAEDVVLLKRQMTVQEKASRVRRA